MKNQLFSKVSAYLRLLRVSDWIKNLFVLVPWLFAKQIFNQESNIKISIAFASFCLISSFVYTLNDRFDCEKDKLHPVKKFRPLASGEISFAEAYVIMALLFILAFGTAALLNIKVIVIIAAYTLINYFYSVFLKEIFLVDIFSIAAGFLLRIAAGAAAINVTISNWLLLTAFFISLFLAIMKRRSEFVHSSGSNSTRKVLSEYAPHVIDQISTITSTGVIICYALYTVSAQTIANFKTDRLIYTTLFVVFGIFRYIYLAHKNKSIENVTEVLLKDIPMLINLLFYIISVTIIIYVK